MEIQKIKNALINLYLSVKIRKLSDIKNLNNDLLEKEEEVLNKLPIYDIINYLSNSIEILTDIKAQDKYEAKILEDEEKEKYININNLENDANGLILYEGMLIKAESDIRNHIRVSIKLIIINKQIEQELKLKIEELERDLETIYNKYNNQIKNYNKLLNRYEHEKNKNNSTLNNKKTQLSENLEVSFLNSSKENINDQQNMLIKNNNENIQFFLRDFINNPRKKREQLKKLIITKGTNPNFYPKKKSNTLKRPNNIIKEKSKKDSEKPKHSSTKKKKKESFYKTQTFNKKRFINELNDRSSILISKHKRYYLNHNSINNNTSTVIMPKRKLIELTNKNNNNFFNTVYNGNENKYKIKKNKTNINYLTTKGKNQSTHLEKSKNKLKDKSKQFVSNKNINLINSNKKNGDKLYGRDTPKNKIKFNEIFFYNTQENINKYNHNKLNKKNNLILDKNYNNINDAQNNIKYIKTDNNNYNNIEEKLEEKRLNKDINNGDNIIISYKNRDTHKKTKNKIIKQNITERNNLKGKNLNDLFFLNKRFVASKLQKKPKNSKTKLSNPYMHKSLINSLRYNDFNRSKSNDKGINRKKYLINNKIENYQFINNGKLNFARTMKNPSNNSASMSLGYFHKYIETETDLNIFKEKLYSNKNRKIDLQKNGFIKNHKNTINNINNFNNCNYIYLFKDEEKLIKVKKK